MPKLTKSLESATRKKIDLILNGLSWKTDEENKDCNVITERAKTDEQRKKLKGKQPDYLLCKSKTNEILAIIEAKRKGQSLEKALKEATEKYAKPLGVSIIFVYDSTFFYSLDLRNNKELTMDDEPIRDFISEERLLRFLNEGSNIEAVNKKVKHSREELIRIFQEANTLLRKEGLRNLDRFIEFSNILFIKIISEIEDNRVKNGLNRRLDESISWGTIMSFKQNPKAMLNYINNTVLKENLAEKYNKSDDIFTKKLKINNEETVKKICEKLDKITLINTESEIKGDAFEYFLKSLTSGNDLGEYFTPRHIVQLMVKLINPTYSNTILDPFCGTGGFLIESFRRMKKGLDESDDNIMFKLREESLFGIELTDTYKIAKMNMIITGDGHNNIVKTDTAKRDYWDKFLKNAGEKKEKVEYLNKIKKKGFDIVFSNIPYSQKTDYGEAYPVPSNNGDSIFIQEIINCLRDGGKCAVVVPEGFLFRRELKNTRKYLLENCSLEAIISLPSGVFMPYTGVKTDILVFTKGKSTKTVWCFVVGNDGFELNANRRKLQGRNDIDNLLDIWVEKKITQNSCEVDIKAIEKNDYNLLFQKNKKSIKKIKIEDSKKLIENAIKLEETISKELFNLRDMIK